MKIKKSLGQNFFVNENLGNYIINILANSNCTSVVEIGPGLGFFTEKLIKKFENVIVIEKDREIAQNLKFQFPKILVINNDFLDIDLNTIASENTTFFGSLPFNVSKKIIKKVIESKYFTNPSFFIIQKEVAEKYTSSSPNNNYLATKTLLYAKTKKILDISPDSFRPKPKVMSSLIGFYPLKKSYGIFIGNKSLEQFDIFLQSAFKQPRKKLLNNLKRYRFKEEQREKIMELLERRAQHTSLEDFYLLFSNILSS